MYKLFLVPILGFFMLQTSIANESVENIKELIGQAKLTEAMTAIEKGLAAKADDIDHLALKSRVQTLQADLIKDEDEKIKGYEKAQKTAEKAVKLAPNNPKGYNRRAVAKGKLILYMGILKSRSLVLELREDAKKSLSLEGSNYDKSLANYLLGRAHIKLAKKPRALRMPLGLAWASKKKGGNFLKKAAELSPEVVSFNVSYGQYLKDNGDKAKAKEILTKVATLKNNDPSDVEHKKTAVKLLGDL